MNGKKFIKLFSRQISWIKEDFEFTIFFSSNDNNDIEMIDDYLYWASFSFMIINLHLK